MRREYGTYLRLTTEVFHCLPTFEDRNSLGNPTNGKGVMEMTSLETVRDQGRSNDDTIIRRRNYLKSNLHLFSNLFVS